MRDELVRRNYAESTIRSYLRIVRQFQQYCRKRLDRLGPDDLRRYQAYLLEERKLAVRTVVQHVAAIRFLYAKTLAGPERGPAVSAELQAAIARRAESRRSDVPHRFRAQP